MHQKAQGPYVKNLMKAFESRRLIFGKGNAFELTPCDDVKRFIDRKGVVDRTGRVMDFWQPHQLGKMTPGVGGRITDQ